jgi:hypothetical protein
MALHFPSAIPDIVRPMTFIHVPKTAGTSFTRWISDNNIAHENHSMHASVAKAKTIWPDLGYTFAFVRNPYDRLVSYFHYVGQQAQRKLIMAEQGTSKKRVDVQQELSIIRVYRQGFYFWLTQEGAGRATAMTMDKTFMNWQEPQLSWTRGADRVIQIENLHKEFQWIQQYFRVWTDLPRDNVSEHGHYQDYYNSETRRIAARLYQQDLDEFKYVF